LLAPTLATGAYGKPQTDPLLKNIVMPQHDFFSPAKAAISGC
jgi:hypothetical protein